MIFGSAVDCLLLDGREEFNRQYAIKPIDYDGPVILTVSAQPRRGAKLEAVLTEATETVFDAPLGSRTMRVVG